MENMPTEIIQQAAKSQDPFLIGLAFIAAAIVIAVPTAMLIMRVVNSFKANSTEQTKLDAEDTLYARLKDQITTNSEEIAKLINERSKWFEKTLYLESEVERLKSFETMVTSMKSRLIEKDRIIEERDAEIRNLTRTILEMKDRLHALEIRIIKDELTFCNTCKYHPEGNPVS